ncbi:MAG: phosphoglycerate kinase [Candidatus Pacebacteria bacterium]|nr:phosphoglycerate kinase [Candidatus Paceibacterota bacterium]
MQSIKKIKNLKSKRVVARVDFNVPLKDGKITDNFRIKKGIPTIKYLVDKGASVTILMHLGKDGTTDINPVIKEFFRLSKLPKSKVNFEKNVRSFKGEEANDPKLGKYFASLGDMYVNDAFSVSHRKHASLVAVTKYLPSYAGLQIEEEVKQLSAVFKNPKRPFLFILGGAKFSTKMPLIKKYLTIADYIYVGGALANDFLESQGACVGESLVDNTISVPKNILNNKKILLPKDVLVKSGDKQIVRKVGEIAKGESILDIGPESVKELSSYIKKSRMILWNGPLGKYEELNGGTTKEILKLIAKSPNIKSIIGGGDTVEMISEMKLEKKFTFVSTGGGATLDFLAKGTLPALDALK